MSKPEISPPDYPDYPDVLIEDEELGITHREYERARGRQAVRQGIEDYFERKKMNEIEDWFGSME